MKVCAAVDLGATNFRVAKINEAGEISAYDKSPVGDVSCGEEVTDKIIAGFENIFGAKKPKIIGISTAGPIDKTKGMVVHSPNMKCDCISLVDPLKEYFGAEVTMLTDCKAAVLGEVLYGLARGANTAVYITLSSGIGTGVFSNGHLLEGAFGNACEVGHLFVDEKYHLPCGCGGYGHWEAYASGVNIPKFYKQWCGKTATAAEIFDAAAAGDKEACAFVDEAARISGRGLSSVIAAYNPDVVIFDGPVARNNPLFVEKMAESAHCYTQMPKICISELKGNAPLLGAAAYVMGLI